jgi:hypothetical protein
MLATRLELTWLLSSGLRLAGYLLMGTGLWSSRVRREIQFYQRLAAETGVPIELFNPDLAQCPMMLADVQAMLLLRLDNEPGPPEVSSGWHPYSQL